MSGSNSILSVAQLAASEGFFPDREGPAHPPVLIEHLEAGEELLAPPNVARALALERENNFVPWRIDVLSGAALETLDNLLLRICLDPDRVSPDALAGAYLLQVALVTGRPVSALVLLPILDVEPLSIKDEHSQGLYRGSRDWGWWLAAGRPTSAQTMPIRARSLYRPTQENMFIRCGERTRSLFQSAVKRKALLLKAAPEGSAACSTKELLPPHGAEVWSDASTRKLTLATLRLLPASQRHALSIRRIENWLYSQVVADTGELAKAAILTGQVTPKSNAMLHYSWISTEDAMRCVHDHTARYELIGPAPLTATVAARRSVPKSMVQAGTGFGSRFVLTSEAVRTLAAVLISKLDEHSSTADFHNSFTLYTIALIGFAAGIRPGQTPIPNWLEIDPDEGWLVWNDKKRNVENQNRLLWLPKVARDQIRFYHDHVRALTDRRMNRWASERWSTMPDARSREHRKPFLVRDQKPRQATQKMVADAFAEVGFPIQKNAWRHYLRTELLGRVPGDVLMACMGHWQRGQDPWDVYSGLDPQAYRQALEEHLVPLLERDGWVARPGLGQAPPLREPEGRPAFYEIGSYV